MLRTSDYEQYKDRNPERLDETCEWFLHHENFHQWNGSNSSTLLWVSADPGCGKSVLAKYLVDQEKTLEATESRAVCYFFFKDDNEDQTSVTTAFSALLHQLFSQRESLIQHAMKDYKAEGSKLPRLFQKLWNILLKAASDPKAREIVCILDGLDECAEKGRDQIIDVLSAFYKQAISEQSSSRLKFLITSRPYYDIERRFAELTRNFPTIRLAGEQESEAIGREIDRVIKWKLSKLALELRLNDTEQATLETELLSMTHRTYLWAKLVFDILYRTIRPTSRRLKEIVRSLPPTVDKAYEAILSRIDDAEQPQARKLLSIVVAASRPLTLHELNVALTVELQHKSYDDLRADLDDEERFETTVRNMCGLFVTILDQKIYLIHQTAREFLVARHEVRDGWKHSLDPVQSELILATSCIVPLMFSDFDEYRMPDDVSLGELLSGFEFLGYAASFWTAHFREAQKQATDELLQLVLQVCNTSSRRFNTWSRLYEMADSSTLIPRFTNTMMVASYLGHDTVVEQLLKESEADVDSKDNDHGRTSLAWAAQQGHISVVRLLVGTGRADANSKDNNDRTPLWLACRSCREDIALFLLENGADPMDKTTRSQSALVESASQGLPKVVDWILQSLSDQALQTIAQQYDAEGKSILNLAVLGENGSQYAIVRMVIDALGRFPDQKRKLLYHQDHSNCSALFHAALRNQAETVKLFVQVEKGLLSQTGYYDWRDTSLHVATHWQSLNTVQVLVNAGADPNIQQRTGHTPLHIASHRPDGHDGAQILKVLLKHADPLVSGNMGENIIHLVLDWDRAIHFQTIANHIPYSDLYQLLTSKNKDGNIPLLHATARLRHADHDYASRSKTFKAICEAMVKVVSDADADAILDLVSEQDRLIVLHRFIETGSVDLMAEIVPKIAALDRSFLEPTDIHGQTLLIKAVDRQQRRTIQLLIESSANVNAQDKLGKTALHYAAERDIPDIAELLIHADADLTIKDAFGRMPVDWCSSRNSCIAIVQPSNRSTTTPNLVATTTPSTRSSRTSWSITLGAEFESCAWNLQGDIAWYSDAVPKIVHEDKYLISETIPVTIKLPVPRVHVMIEGRDQGWSNDRWFSDRPEGSFTSDTSYALAILRDGHLVLRREWARNKHRSKTPHRFECTWYADSRRNREHVHFAGRRPVSADDQGEFVRRLTVGDQVVVLSLAGGSGWMNIVKCASVEIFFED
jgi:ankyrin repeat protein